VIAVSAEIENLSTKVMKLTIARLYQDVTFRAANTKKVTSTIIQQVGRGEIKAGESDNWNGLQLLIPQSPSLFPTNLGGCNIIGVTYRLEFRVEPSDLFASDLVVSIPIIIGNNHLRLMYPQF